MGLPFNMDEVWACDAQQFNELALRLFHYQSKNNKVFSDYLNLIDVVPESIDQLEDIPYLPIGFFKTHEVLCQGIEAKIQFRSSGTGEHGRSRHLIYRLEDYHLNCQSIFEQRFRAVTDYELLGLLPSYIEQGESSLVSMVDHLAQISQTAEPHFYLYDHQALEERLLSNSPTILFGVSYALLDFAKGRKMELPQLKIIETGGMKGRKKEITKQEVYRQLSAAFPLSEIISEYGMTELMSQAYTQDEGIYQSPPWMRVSLRADNDPLSSEHDQRGAINIIDLANIHSCAFIATDDVGRLTSDGSFEVLGRLDHSDIRGCSLMWS